jgi:hypothetical protein
LVAEELARVGSKLRYWLSLTAPADETGLLSGDAVSFTAIPEHERQAARPFERIVDILTELIRERLSYHLT